MGHAAVDIEKRWEWPGGVDGVASFCLRQATTTLWRPRLFQHEQAAKRCRDMNLRDVIASRSYRILVLKSFLVSSNAGLYPSGADPSPQQFDSTMTTRMIWSWLENHAISCFTPQLPTKEHAFPWTDSCQHWIDKADAPLWRLFIKRQYCNKSSGTRLVLTIFNVRCLW